MKLAYPEKQILIHVPRGKISFLIIENVSLMEVITIEAKKTVERKSDQIRLYEQEERKDMHLCSEVILTPLDLTYEKKDIQKKLGMIVLRVAEEQNFICRFTETNGEWVSLLEEIDFCLDCQLDYETDVGLNELMKIYNVRIAEPQGTFSERFIEYAENLHRMLGKYLFVVINCGAYIKSEEYRYIKETAQLYDLAILFIESRQNQLLASENTYIIDEDLCEIH